MDSKRRAGGPFGAYSGGWKPINCPFGVYPRGQRPFQGLSWGLISNFSVYPVASDSILRPIRRLGGPLGAYQAGWRPMQGLLGPIQGIQRPFYALSRRFGAHLGSGQEAYPVGRNPIQGPFGLHSWGQRPIKNLSQGIRSIQGLSRVYPQEAVWNFPLPGQQHHILYDGLRIARKL